MFRNILVAFNGSPESDTALSLSLSLAHDLDAKLHALAVIDLRQKRPHIELEAERRHTWQTLRDLEPTALRAGVPVEIHLAEGVPAEQIVLQAQELGADIIVLGHHQRTTLVQRFAGTTEQDVIGHAPCAVMLAPSRSVERRTS
jgi:nucleotide-binding universal stress UspA family protein